MQILDHNLKAYKALIKSFKKSNRACIVHPTGLGKSYIAYQLIADNPYSALGVRHEKLGIKRRKEKLKFAKNFIKSTEVYPLRASL